MSNEKDNYKKVFLVLAAIVIFVGLAACLGVYLERDSDKTTYKPKATVQPLIDQKEKNFDSLLLIVNRLVNSINTSKQSIIIQREGFTNNYQQALETSPDVCLPTIKQMYRMAMSMDSSNAVVIRKQDSTIVTQSKAISEKSDVVSLQKFQLQQKTDSIAQLQEGKKATAKANKRQRIKQVLKNVVYNVFSFGAGYGAGKITP